MKKILSVIYGFLETLGSFWVAAQLAAAEEGSSCMKLVRYLNPHLGTYILVVVLSLLYCWRFGCILTNEETRSRSYIKVYTQPYSILGQFWITWDSRHSVESERYGSCERDREGDKERRDLLEEKITWGLISEVCWNLLQRDAQKSVETLQFSFKSGSSDTFPEDLHALAWKFPVKFARH
jgi:hypothetical protein